MPPLSSIFAGTCIQTFGLASSPRRLRAGSHACNESLLRGAKEEEEEARRLSGSLLSYFSASRRPFRVFQVKEPKAVAVRSRDGLGDRRKRLVPLAFVLEPVRDDEHPQRAAFVLADNCGARSRQLGIGHVRLDG